MKLLIIGAPRTKNTGKVSTRRGVRVIPSRPYRQWFANAIRQKPFIVQAFASAGVERPITTPVKVSAVFYRDRNVGDLDRYLIGLGDFLQRALVIENDKQIASWDGSRLELDRDRPRIEIALEICA